MRASFLVAILAMAVGLSSSAQGQEPGQSALERLESKIRKQAAPPAAPAKPAAEGPELMPRQPAVPPPPAPAVVPAGKPGNQRPYLGITVDDKADQGRGVRILQVQPKGPGALAGLQSQDLITGIDARPVGQMTEMAEILLTHGPGDKITLDIARNNQPQKVELTLGRPPAAAVQPPRADEPLVPPLRAEPGAPLPPPPAAVPPTDQARIEALELRIEQLERRVQQLEQAAAKSKPN